MEVTINLSVIDTLTAGFSALMKRVWLLIVPIALDLFIWLGPQVSIAPLFEQLSLTADDLLRTLGSANSPDANMMRLLQQAIVEMKDMLGPLNLLSFLVSSPVGLPSVTHSNLLVSLASGRLGLPLLSPVQLINPQAEGVIAIADPLQALIWQLVLWLAGLLIACGYLGLLAQHVRGEAPQWMSLLHRLPTYWLYLLAAVALQGAVSALFSFSSLVCGPFALVVFMALLFLSFMPQAITLADAKPLQAAMSSLIIVRLNFGAVLGLFLLIYVINSAVNLVCRLLMISDVGIVVAIMANAFVGTGLTLAWFIFYRDRLARLREALAKQPSGVRHE